MSIGDATLTIGIAAMLALVRHKRQNSQLSVVPNFQSFPTSIVPNRFPRLLHNVFVLGFFKEVSRPGCPRDRSTVVRGIASFRRCESPRSVARYQAMSTGGRS